MNGSTGQAQRAWGGQARDANGALPPYPFSAIVGQERLLLALLLNAVSPAIGGVLVRGEKGTAKSTAARALAALLPEIEVTAGCRFNCPPGSPFRDCPDCLPDSAGAVRNVPFIELPVGATEDRVIGNLNIERAIRLGERAYEPGLLAAAHRGVLYVDEVNLLGDQVVDVLLDAAAMGWNVVEREGVSFSHPAKFILVGTMNPEEGDLRPQLLDRFGLAVEIAASRDPAERAQVVRRRIEYERQPELFAQRFAPEEQDIRRRVAIARQSVADVEVDDETVRLIAEICCAFEVEGLRADIVIYKAAAALAAWNGRAKVGPEDVQIAAELALPHRRRRQPFEQPGIDTQQLADQIAQATAGDRPSPRESDNSEDDSRIRRERIAAHSRGSGAEPTLGQ